MLASEGMYTGTALLTGYCIPYLFGLGNKYDGGVDVNNESVIV